MLIAIVFIIIFLVILLTIVSVFYVKRQNEQWEKCYNAAFNIIKEDMLDYSIKNLSNTYEMEPSGARMMIELKMLNAKKKDSYVFDPAKGVSIGRKKAEGNNMICLNDISVSGNHCMIYGSGNNVYLQDMGSSNGSTVKRGFRKYFVGNGNVMELRTKDKLFIGISEFKINIFYYDVFMMQR